MRCLVPVAAAFLFSQSPAFAQLKEGSPEREDALTDRVTLQLQIDRLMKERKKKEAIAVMWKAVAVDKTLDGAASKRVCLTLTELADTAFEAEAYTDEAKAYKELLPLSEKVFGETHWRTMTVKRKAERVEVILKFKGDDLKYWDAVRRGESQAFGDMKDGKIDKSLEMWALVLKMTEGLFTKNSYHYATNSQMVAFTYYRGDRFDKAQVAFAELVELERELFGEPHPETTINRYFLGSVLRKGDRMKEAEPHLLKSLKDSRPLVAEGGIPKVMLFDMIRGLSSFYMEQYDYPSAQPFLTEAHEMAEKEYGQSSRQHAEVLLSELRLHTASGEFKEAEEVLVKAEKLFPQLYKPPHLEIVRLYRGAGWLHKSTGQFEVARDDLGKALKMLGELKNADLSEEYHCRSDLGLVLLELGRGDDAVAIFEDLKKVAKESSGEKSSRYAANLHNLALAHWGAGSTANAEKYYKQAIAIKEAQEKDSLDCAISLEGLGGLYLFVQDFARAEPLLLKATAIREKHFGPKHPSYGMSCNELGVMYLDRGDLRKAQFYLTKTVEIWKAAAPSQPFTAKALDNLAKYYREIEDIEKAVELWEEALVIRRKVLPPDSPDLIVGLNNLAGGYFNLIGRGTIKNAFPKAEALYREALERAERNKKHPKFEIAVMWHNLGHMLVLVPDRRAEAIAAYDQAMNAWEQYEAAQPGRKPHHLKVALLISLSTVRLQDNKPQEAMAFSAEALKIARSYYSNDSNQLDSALLKHSVVLHACGKEREAAELLRELIGIHDQQANDVLGFTSEKDMLEFFSQHLQQTFHRVVRRAADNPEDTKAKEFAFELVCRRKGIILDRLCESRNMERQLNINSALALDVREYRGLKDRIAKMTLNPRPGDTPETARALQRKADELQGTINRKMSEIAPQKASKFNVADIRSKLAPKSALIEFVRTDIIEMPLGDKGFNRVERYVAFVLPAETNKPLQIFDLGPADKIDTAVTLLRERLKPFDPGNELREERAYRKSATAVYDLLFKEMQPALAGVESLVIVPDGSLYRVPFTALVGADKKYLIESLHLSVIPSCRDLFKAVEKQAGTDVVVFANPDYDNGAPPNPNKTPPPLVVATRGPSPDVPGLGWKRLPATAGEARDIERTMKNTDFGRVRTFEDKVATEEEVKRVNAPRILHLATHGTYVEKIQNQNAADLHTPGSRQTNVDNPLLRSAIVLAGVNQPHALDAEDGLLTAEEVSLLNLHGTELVVLSACESGLGEVKSSEGVFGLHRAFLYAGARSIVVTLYAVPDAETGQVMKRFYENLAAKKGKAESLHQAQLATLQDRRGEDGKKPAHPLFWAAFVLIGEGK